MGYDAIAKLDELTTFHIEFPKGFPGFHNSIQFMIMNKAKYQGLGCCRFRGHRPKLLKLSQSLSD